MLSLIVAVTVWLPAVSARENDAPVPIWPSRFDRQVILLEMSPSGLSWADPENDTAVPGAACCPLVGLCTVSVGGVSGAPAPPAYSALAPAMSSDDSVRIDVEQRL